MDIVLTGELHYNEKQPCNMRREKQDAEKKLSERAGSKN